MTIIPKKYNFDFEQELYESWKKAWFFSPAVWHWPAFVIPLPPPNVTGDLHLWHAVMLAIEDAMIRYARLQWKRALWIPGTDHAWIATQVVVERNLRRDARKTKEQLWRTEFLDMMRKWVRQSRSTITNQIQQIGASVDRSKEEFTLSEQLSRAVRKAFTTLYQQWKIYRDTYMVNRSPEAKTVLSDLEVDYKEEQVSLYYIKYFVQGKWESLTVATVRPETIFGDVAVAVNPKDRRYKKWIWKNVLIPIINKLVPIIADERVSMEFGTWVLKITPSHAEEDFLIARDHKLPLQSFAFDKTNHYTELAGDAFAWKHIYEFMDNLIQELREIGNLEHIEPYTTTLPYCERTWCRVQPLLSPQWFFDVQDAAGKVQTMIDDQTVKVHPERFGKQFTQWLEKIRPRCISRQLRRWHRIPVWYDENGEKYVFDEDSCLQTDNPHKIISQIIFNLIADSRLTNPFTPEQLIDVLMQPSLTTHRGQLWHVYIAMYRIKYEWNKSFQKTIDLLESIFSSTWPDAAIDLGLGEQLLDLLENAPQIVSHGDMYRFNFMNGDEVLTVTQDEDVLDTWFSSGLWPFTILWWPEKTPDLQHFYPNTVLETWYDIIFFRVIRMMLMGVSLTDQMPFKHVYLHGLVRASDGQKMSKSKWNGIDPLKMIATYGADALRGALILWNTPWNDQKFSEQKVEYVWKFINKFWNATRFVQSQLWSDAETQKEYHAIGQLLQNESKLLSEYDTWILNKVDDLIVVSAKWSDKFMLGEALQEIITCVRHDFCDWYVEIVKSDKSELTQSVLLYVLWTACILLHPSCPFVSEQLWKSLWFTWSLMKARWPEPLHLWIKNYKFNLLMEIITQFRSLRLEVTNQPNEEVTLFVQANHDIHEILINHTPLIKKILRASELICVNEHEQLPSDIVVGVVLDIKLWVRGLVVKDRKAQLQDLEKEIVQEEQFLQRLRAQLSSSDFLDKAPVAVVHEKKEKMQEVKNKILLLQHEVQRLKMEHK